MKHAVKHIHFVGPTAAQRTAIVIAAAFAAGAAEVVVA
jgi:hypothetical protein